jgi:hypothetical protein
MELPRYSDNTGKNKTSALATETPPPAPTAFESTIQESAPSTAPSPATDSFSSTWSQKAQTYLTKGEFPASVQENDTRSPKDRARNFGLRNFASMDWDKDGRLEPVNIQVSSFADGKSDMLGARVMLENFQVIDTSKDGFVDKGELVATSSEKVVFPNVPNQEILDTKPIDPAAQAKTNEVISKRLDLHPHESPNNFLDSSIEALSSAIVKGDIETVDAMVKTFSANPAEFRKIAGGVSEALKGSDSEIWLRGGYFSVSNPENEVIFSKSDKPFSKSFHISPEDAMKQIGRSTANGDRGIQDWHKKMDQLQVEETSDAKLLDGLNAKLTTDDKAVAMRLLDKARHGESEFFQEILTIQVYQDPQSAYRLGKALNEITKGQDIDFNMVSVSDESFMQIRNEKGDKALTIAPARTKRYPQGIIGAENVRPSRDGSSSRQIMRWVTESIVHGRDRSLKEKGE